MCGARVESNGIAGRRATGSRYWVWDVGCGRLPVGIYLCDASGTSEPSDSDSAIVDSLRLALSSSPTILSADVTTGHIGDSVERPLTAEINHVALCPLGGAATRWYLCAGHGPGLVFSAGSGQVDSVANSCPLCGCLCRQFLGCACEYAHHPLDRSTRPGRRIRLRGEPHVQE